MALFIALPLTPLSLYVFCALIGFLWLGTAPLTNGLVAQVFGVRYLGTLFGFVFLGHQLGAFFGVWLGGYVYEHTHSYNALWLGSIALSLMAAALHWPIDDRELQRRRALPAGRRGLRPNPGSCIDPGRAGTAGFLTLKSSS